MIGPWEQPTERPQAEGTDVLLRREGPVGHLTLNRPQAINALTTEMVRQLHVAFDELAADDTIQTVLLDGAGDRGFCAGGDIIALHRSAVTGTEEAPIFWAEEYALDARIARFEKPVVAIMDGIVMGGGIGLSGHASHRVATERLTAAMPEVGIGFAPDVGGTWLLARAPGELGTHLALTAGRAGAQDALTLGLADAIVAADRISVLADELRAGASPDEAIALAAAEPPAALPAGSLAAARSWIDPAFAGDSAEAILARLDAAAEANPAAAKAATAIRRGSPTSIKVTLQALRRAAELPDLEAALEQELVTSCAFLRAADFAEGIRAQVIDKDRSPRWDPPTLPQVDGAYVARFFPESSAAARAADRQETTR